MTYRKPVAPILFATLLALSLGALPGAAQSTDYLVTFQQGTSRAERSAAAARHGAAIRYNFSIIDSIAVNAPNQNVLRALAQDPAVLRITPDYAIFASQAPQSGERVHADKRPGSGGSGGGTTSGQVVPVGVQRVLKSSSSPSNSSGSGIGVAIVDTGIDYNHGDLMKGGSSIVADRYNALDNSDNCMDDNGHGTHVAGTVAAQDNTQDVVGVAPGVNLFCVKVLNAQGSGSWATVIAGLDWINLNHAGDVRVVNMSLGGSGVNEQSDLRDAIERLRNKGIVVVVAAGNDRNLDVSQQVPAAYSNHVITVASTTAIDGSANKCRVRILADTASYFSSTGLGVTISAPGEEREDTRPGCLLSSVGVLSLKLGGGTTRMSGTSMATPHVTGIVARVLESPGSYGLPAVVPASQEALIDVRNYLTDHVRGADLQGCAPIPSPTSGPNDGFKEGVSILSASTASCLN